ncbi:armadillo-type protein [Dipodascopsis tothii]|uniref:armadillo-type protein n=1 Tax=Dipodascopsis tothii TaxID=44089 RepID=UPI0034CD20D4
MLYAGHLQASLPSSAAMSASGSAFGLPDDKLPAIGSAKPDSQLFKEPLATDYAPLGASIWRRTSMSTGSSFDDPAEPAGLYAAGVPMTSSTSSSSTARSISLGLGGQQPGMAGQQPLMSPGLQKVWPGNVRQRMPDMARSPYPPYMQAWLSDHDADAGAYGYAGSPAMQSAVMAQQGLQSAAAMAASGSMGCNVPIGTPLSAYSKEFTPLVRSQTGGMMAGGVAGSAAVGGMPGAVQTYNVTLQEPINYRRLLEKSVNCNWKYIVDKIVNNNDQQASIFLQQKLKIGTPEQKYSIVEAIVEQAYLLMINRFGNFLVQRCFEHGAPDQINRIADSIRGNVIALAMDAFGCHVIQKALDSVEERIRASMVNELLHQVADTIVHRYACHVWQKLFELRWDSAPPPIMSYVNKELKGMWTQVALGETGSLVVQNIFENCLEEDKRPCIEEVLENIDVITRGQWGNWVIQHMIEHGSERDSTRALDVIIYNAAQYSVEQYASKVIEKLLKCGRPEVIDRYLARICEGLPNRPRIPLIDIASDAHGNYLIQYILQNATQPQRDLVASQIRKHMVSLRGSKWGSKCAWIVESSLSMHGSSGMSGAAGSGAKGCMPKRSR